MRLGIDLDGVVANFNAGWMARYNRDFGATLDVRQVVMWDGLHSLTHFAAMNDFWAWARSGPTSIFRDLPPISGALPALERLAQDHEVVILSSKFDWAIPDTLAWLAEHRVLAREIHFVWDKTSVACDVYLEDAPHNLSALVARRPAALVCRMVRPWNRPVPGTTDVHDWVDFEAQVAARTRGRGPDAEARPG